MFNTETLHLDWETVYPLPFKITLGTKLRGFQYKILHRVCYTNVMFKFGLAETPLCSFCNEELETLEQFLFHCQKVNTFWNELNTILKSQDLVSTNFDIKGHFCSDDDDSILANYIILESKYLIFRSKLSKSPFSASLLFAKSKKNIPNRTFHCE